MGIKNLKNIRITSTRPNILLKTANMLAIEADNK